MQFAECEALANNPCVDATPNQAKAFLDHSKKLERITLHGQRIQRANKNATARLEKLQALPPRRYYIKGAELRIPVAGLILTTRAALYPWPRL